MGGGRFQKTDVSAGRRAERSSLLERTGDFPPLSAVSEEYSQVTTGRTGSRTGVHCVDQRCCSFVTGSTGRFFLFERLTTNSTCGTSISPGDFNKVKKAQGEGFVGSKSNFKVPSPPSSPFPRPKGGLGACQRLKGNPRFALVME